MLDKSARDLTQGNMLRHIVNFAVPMFMGNILQTINTTMDGIWVGRFLGPSALGAVAVTFPITFLLVSFVMGLAMATTVLVSQYAGAKNVEKIKETIYNSFLLLAVAGVIVTAAGILCNRAILRLMNVPEEIVPVASGYLVILLSGLIFLFGYNGVSAVQKGLGDSRTPLYFLTMSVVFNIVLNPFLILGIGFFPRMEVQGAALATVLSQFLAFVAAFFYLTRKTIIAGLHIKYLRFDKELTIKTLKIGIPTGVQSIVISMAAMFLGSIINSFGIYSVAAYGIATNLDKLAIAIAMSVTAAVTTITAQNIGAGNEQNVKDTLKWAWLLVIVTGGLFSSLAMLFPGAILGIFTNDANVILAGKQYLRIAALSYIPLSIGYVTNGVLRGAGDAFPTMLFTMIALWGVRVPLAEFLSAPMGVSGVWLAIAASSIVGMLLSTSYYATGRWKPVQLSVNRPEHMYGNSLR